MKTTTKKGDIYHQLQAIEFSHQNENKIIFWKFKCLLCGKINTSRLYDVRSGKTKSCGCTKNKGVFNGNWKGFKGIHGKVYTHYKALAEKRNISFEISIGDLWEVYINQNKKCPYTGIELSLVSENVHYRNPINASLDRIDSTKGYTKNNIQWIYKPLNKLKGTLSHQEFIELCQMVNKHCPYGTE